MSHFSLLVVTSDKDSLEEALALFDEHLEVPPRDDGEVCEEDIQSFINCYKDDKDYSGDFDEDYKTFGNDWNFSVWKKNVITGKYHDFITYNPNSKWDWYIIGGRWADYIKLKENVPEEEYTKARPLCSGAGTLNEVAKNNPDSWPHKAGFHLGEFCSQTLVKHTELEHLKKNPTYALLKDGIWYSEEDMGWFGISTNEGEEGEWAKEYSKLIDSLEEDETITLVDCHI